MHQADAFIATLDHLSMRKVFFTIELAEHIKDPRIFKKIRNHIWEFRIRSGHLKIRMLAFWYTIDREKSFVIVTHGFVKKSSRVPLHEIRKSERLRIDYIKNH
jgi:phage-related protein